MSDVRIEPRWSHRSTDVLAANDESVLLMRSGQLAIVATASGIAKKLCAARGVPFVFFRDAEAWVSGASGFTVHGARGKRTVKAPMPRGARPDSSSSMPDRLYDDVSGNTACRTVSTKDEHVLVRYGLDGKELSHARIELPGVKLRGVRLFRSGAIVIAETKAKTEVVACVKYDGKIVCQQTHAKHHGVYQPLKWRDTLLLDRWDDKWLAADSKRGTIETWRFPRETNLQVVDDELFALRGNGIARVGAKGELGRVHDIAGLPRGYPYAYFAAHALFRRGNQLGIPVRTNAQLRVHWLNAISLASTGTSPALSAGKRGMLRARMSGHFAILHDGRNAYCFAL